MTPRIPVTAAQIDRVVSEFYRRVRVHPTLGPIFAAHVADWPAHEKKIGQFWRNALLLQRCYDGNPMQTHRAAGNVGHSTSLSGCRCSTLCSQKNCRNLWPRHGLPWHTGSAAG